MQCVQKRWRVCPEDFNLLSPATSIQTISLTAGGRRVSLLGTDALHNRMGLKHMGQGKQGKERQHFVINATSLSDSKDGESQRQGWFVLRATVVFQLTSSRNGNLNPDVWENL